MQIYESEIKDGLSDIIQANAKLVITAETRLIVGEVEKNDVISKLIAQANPNQLDLFYLESILVSTGWNKNDDVFLPQEMWNARLSPVLTDIGKTAISL